MLDFFCQFCWLLVASSRILAAVFGSLANFGWLWRLWLLSRDFPNLARGHGCAPHARTIVGERVRARKPVVLVSNVGEDQLGTATDECSANLPADPATPVVHICADLEAEGIDLVHVIGPGTKHAIHPDSKKEIDRRLSSIARAGRERFPRHVVLATWTLKYNRMHWVTVEGMGEHWQAARIVAEVTSRSRVTLTTKNVTGVRLAFPPGFAPLDVQRPVTVVVDGIELEAPRPRSDRSWTCRLTKQEGGGRGGGNFFFEL